MSHQKDRLCLLVHGFNVSDGGENTVGRFRPYFIARGWDTITFQMGWMGLIQVYTQNHQHAKRLAEAARNAHERGTEVIALGHSNGCAVLHLATTEYDAPIQRMAYINPALEHHLAPAPQVERLDVWHSPSDRPVKWSRLMPFSLWGAMGAVGYTGDDPRVFNFNKRRNAGQ